MEPDQVVQKDPQERGDQQPHKQFERDQIAQ
jgi:hypothetical protein